MKPKVENRPMEISTKIFSWFAILCSIVLAINHTFLDKDISAAIAWLACAFWAFSAYIVEHQRDKLAEQIFNRDRAK